MPGFRRILHAIHGHFANPYAAAERFRSSGIFASRCGNGRDIATPSKLDRQGKAFQNFTATLLERAPPLPLGIGLLSLAIVILGKTWKYSKTPSSISNTIIGLIGFIVVIFTCIGVNLIYNSIISSNSRDKDKDFTLHCGLYTSGIVIGLYFSDRAIFVGWPIYCGIMLVGVIRRHWQSSNDA